METKLLSNKILEKQIEIEDRFLTSSHLQSCQLLVRGEGRLRHILQLVSWEISDIIKNCSHQIFTISNVIVLYMNYTTKPISAKLTFVLIERLFGKRELQSQLSYYSPVSCEANVKEGTGCSTKTGIGVCSFKGFLVKVIKVFSSVLDMTWIHRYAFSTFLFKAGLTMRLEH